MSDPTDRPPRPPAPGAHAATEFRALVETSPAGLWQITPEGRTLYANPAMCAMLEVDGLDELRGLDAFSFFPPASREIMRVEHARRAQGRSTSYEVELIARRGCNRWVVISGAPILSADGRLTSMVGTFTDVTAQRAAERALHDSEQRLRLALSAAGMASWDVDLIADRVSFSHEGATSTDGLSRSMTEHLHPAEVERMREMFARHAADPSAGDSFSIEYRTVTDDGEIRWRHAQGTFFRDESGRARRVLGVSLDISERKRMEAELRESSKLESLGRLAGGIAHDFNNLLTVVMTSVHLVQAREDKDAASLAEIRRAAERARELTGQLLAFARQQVIRMRVVDVGALLGGVTSLLERVLGEHIQLETTSEPGLWHVRADASQLEQVLVNLAINARDAMPDGGRLTVTARNERFDTTAVSEHAVVSPGEYVVISVRDTGVGVEDDIQAHIFEPFFTRKSSGTGLGLATCYGIVKQLGGHIRLHSRPGEGATFDVILPRTLEPVEVDSSEPVVVGNVRGSETVLLVEDEDPVRTTTESLLRRQGYLVLSASDGAAALDILESRGEEIALLLSDVVMPKMSGTALARRARQLYPRLKILLVSGYTDDLISVAEGLPPDTAFLQKPYAPAELTARLRTLLDD